MTFWTNSARVGPKGAGRLRTGAHPRTRTGSEPEPATNRNKSRNKNRNQNPNRNRSLFRSRSIARTTNRPGRTPWIGCAAASGSGRRAGRAQVVPEEDDQDAVLPEWVPLRERLSAAAQWVRDRIPTRDLENPDDAPEEPPEPEPTMDDAAREQKWQCARLHRQRLLLTAPTLLAIAVAVIDGLDLLSQGWYDHVWLRCGIPAGLLALCLLLSTRLWHGQGRAWVWARHRPGGGAGVRPGSPGGQRPVPVSGNARICPLPPRRRRCCICAPA